MQLWHTPCSIKYKVITILWHTMYKPTVTTSMTTQISDIKTGQCKNKKRTTKVLEVNNILRCWRCHRKKLNAVAADKSMWRNCAAWFVVRLRSKVQDPTLVHSINTNYRYQYNTEMPVQNITSSVNRIRITIDWHTM